MENNRLELTPAICCLCGADDAEAIGVGFDYEYKTTDDRFSAVQCRKCSLVYLDPRPTLADMETIYPAEYHACDFSKEDYGLVHKIRSRLEARRLLDYCGPLPDGARILDVGCGDGFHLRLLREFGNKTWELEGIDLDRRAIEAAESSGLKVHFGSVESLDLDNGSYDLIFMIQTIEHVERPDEIMSAIFRLLKTGGRLVIVTDNTDSIDFGLFKSSYWGGYHFPRHLCLFNKVSLTRLGENAGFRVASLTTLVSPVNWVYSIHNALVDKRAPKFLIDRFTLRSVVSLSAFTLLDIALQKAKRGALLLANLQKPQAN
ncbi:MAG: class I SAM-dependent methyltransferase [Acidobacteria bacterium]|nr:class I SAM-dependent methyltransferase [Acidobacteriota bacterium]